MNEKILKMLKPLVADKGLNKDELESLANIAGKNLTDASTDEEISDVVNGITPFVELMQKVGNRYATAIEDKYKGWVNPNGAKQAQSKSEVTAKKNVQETTPAITADDIQKLIEAKVAERMKPFELQAEAKRLKSLLDGNERIKNIPLSFRQNYRLEKEEDLDSVANKIESDYAALKQEQLRSGEFVTPPTGSQPADDNDALIDKLQKMNNK